MLKLLQIRNFMLIDSLDVEFEEGLCVITGETGAGKSIIVNSLNFLSGDKGINIAVKKGAEFLLIAGMFSTNEFLNDLLFSYGIRANDESLIIKRVLKKNGIVKNFVNDVQVTLKTLSNLCREIMDINMQGKRVDNYRKILDEYGKISLGNLKAIYHKLQNNKKEQDLLLERASILEVETKYMLSIKNELEFLDLKINEEAELLETRNKIINKEKRALCLSESLGLLSEANEKIHKAQKVLSSLGDRRYEENVVTLESFHIEISEMLLQMQECLTSFEEFSEDDLPAIDSRISKIKDVERKYEKSTADLMAYMVLIDEKLEHYENILSEIKRLENLNIILRKEYMLEAEVIHLERKKVAIAIEEGIKDVLKELELQHCKFFIDCIMGEEHFTDYGFDKIDFKVSFNPDVETNSLLAVASGGEKSRFLLALKMIFTTSQILVCDEMDTGFSGSTSESVGMALLKLALKRQVIVITHQPQVASKGNFHLKILKSHICDKTVISFVKLSQEMRVEEIARMVSGAEITEESMILSKKLLCASSVLEKQ